MIKRIEIKNYKGVKEQTVLDFQLPHLKPGQIEKENTFIYKDGVKAMAVPTLIAKNASGKTSILEAIKFADEINSLTDLTNWVTRDIKKFNKDIDSAFKFVVNRLQRSVDENTEIDSLKEMLLSSLERTSRTLRFGEIFDDHLYRSSLSNEYLKEGVLKLEDKIINRAKQITSHIHSDMFDSITKSIRETTIKIEYSNGKSKEIVIGSEISFNNESQRLDNLLNEVIYDFENGEYVSDGFASFNGFFLYAIGEYSYDMIDFPKFTINSTKTRSSVREAEKAAHISVKLIDDDVIRSKISKDDSRDWGGEALINNFINNYGPSLSSDIIKAIDKSIKFIEGSHDSGVWVLKDEQGTARSISDLSFGTFKTIFILTEIYTAWKKQKVLLIDEIENGLNISLIELIVKFATNERVSRDGFQMIVTTHNPLIFDLGVINPQNAFVNITGTFEKLADNKELISRSEDYDKVFAAKNYFNEFYWLKSFNKPGQSSHTIIKDDIFELLDEVEESLL